MDKALAEIQVPVAKTYIQQRAVYRINAKDGRSVYAIGWRGAAAVAGLEQLKVGVIH
jgi:chromosome partitioning protein